MGMLLSGYWWYFYVKPGKDGCYNTNQQLDQLLHACNLTGRSVGCPGVKGCLLADVIKPVVVLSRYY